MKNILLNYLIKTSCLFQAESKANKSRKFAVKSLLIFGALTISIALYWQSKAIAQETSNTPTKTTQFKVTFDPPAENMPKSSMGGASRTINQCVNEAQNSAIPFSALLPTSTQGLTAASHPTILAYLPETSAQKVFFSWRDENDRDHYQAILPIEKKAGIISLSLSENAPPLEVGKNYQWALGIMCDDRLQPDSPLVQGQVKRVELESTIQSSLDRDISLKNAALYGENGLWYETVATLAQLKAAQPNDRDLALNWSELLDSVGLKKIADAPLNISHPDDK